MEERLEAEGLAEAPDTLRMEAPDAVYFDLEELLACETH